MRRARRIFRAVVVSIVAVGAAAITFVTGNASSLAATGTLTNYRIVTGPTQQLDGPGQVTGTVSCAPGQVAIGGGVNDENPLARVTATYPDLDNHAVWNYGVYQPDHLGRTEIVTPYAVCVDASSVPGFAVQWGSWTPLPPGRFRPQSFACVGNHISLGGGFSVTDPWVLTPIDRWDSAGLGIWSAYFYNPGPDLALTVTTYVVCVPPTDVTTFAREATADGDPGTLLTNPVAGSDAAVTNTARAPDCPPGTLTTGGGAALTDLVNGFISSVHPDPADPRTWVETTTDLNPGDSTPSATAVVVCASATPAPPCDVTVSGSHGSVVASTGLTCVWNAELSGAITVGKGAHLDVEQSTVSGSIIADKSAAIQVCGSSVGGAVSLTRVTGPIRFGDPSESCAGNVVDGSLIAQHNTGGGVVAGNTIAGGWTISANRPALVVSDNTL